MLDAKIKQNKLIDQSDISNLVKNSDLNSTLATEAELKAEQNKIVKPQTFYSSCIHCKRHFEDDCVSTNQSTKG